mmetsp:Transcript_22882/g.74541  ORF Transcript_22882/g.74541 Transcript_22882/m.74541 type:complete len:237 (-) Transcript_22882:17-727(-)
MGARETERGGCGLDEIAGARAQGQRCCRRGIAVCARREAGVGAALGCAHHRSWGKHRWSGFARSPRGFALVPPTRGDRVGGYADGGGARAGGAGTTPTQHPSSPDRHQLCLFWRRCATDGSGSVSEGGGCDGLAFDRERERASAVVHAPQARGQGDAAGAAPALRTSRAGQSGGAHGRAPDGARGARKGSHRRSRAAPPRRRPGRGDGCGGGWRARARSGHVTRVSCAARRGDDAD